MAVRWCVMLVDEFMPVYDVSDAVATVVEADLATTWAALMDVDLIDVGRRRPLVAMLGGFGSFPTSSAICCTANCRHTSQSDCGSAISRSSRSIKVAGCFSECVSRTRSRSV